MKSLSWQEGILSILDQRLLPEKVEYIECRNWLCVADCIRGMAVRGAPAIGAAAAYGMALAAREHARETEAVFCERLKEAAAGLKGTRPTAVNLAWAVDRLLSVAEKQRGQSPQTIADLLLKEAEAVALEDEQVNRAIGEHGATLVGDKSRILTHCNAGALATVGYGTALGIIRSAVAQGKEVHVFADETRPYLQGSRLTAFELGREDIPVTVIADNMAGFLMKQRKVDLVLVGADRIAANGDVANKIGTYSLAVLAYFHGIPFYVAAPLSTFDPALKSGDEIPIEERPAKELTHFLETRLVPEGVGCYNPSFDVTPAGLITAIITEKGIIEKPDAQKIRLHMENEA